MRRANIRLRRLASAACGDPGAARTQPRRPMQQKLPAASNGNCSSSSQQHPAAASNSQQQPAAVNNSEQQPATASATPSQESRLTSLSEQATSIQALISIASSPAAASAPALPSLQSKQRPAATSSGPPQQAQQQHGRSAALLHLGDCLLPDQLVCYSSQASRSSAAASRSSRRLKEAQLFRLQHFSNGARPSTREASASGFSRLALFSVQDSAAAAAAPLRLSVARQTGSCLLHSTHLHFLECSSFTPPTPAAATHAIHHLVISDSPSRSPTSPSSALRRLRPNRASSGRLAADSRRNTP